jgi:hypothetical protein
VVQQGEQSGFQGLVMAALSLQLFDGGGAFFRSLIETRPNAGHLVLSSSLFNDNAVHSVLAMITSAEQSSWPGDLVITSDSKAAGLTTLGSDENFLWTTA